MAINFGDYASGFRHCDVIRFINNEVLTNGGGPDFYQAFRSQPWNEVEDRLRAVLADPKVPRAMKRACAWSALALSVRVGARQQEEQATQVRWLQERVGEREVAYWALAAELQRLREERDEAAVQLRCARAALRQVIHDRDTLHGRLRQVERSAQVAPLAHQMVPGPQPLQPVATAWPMDTNGQGQMVAMVPLGMLHSEGQMAAPAGVLYVPAPQSLWVQAMPPPLPMSVAHPYPLPVPFPMEFLYSTPLPPSAGEAAMAATATVAPIATAAVIPQMSTPVIYPPGPWAAVEAQGEMAPPYDQSCYGQEKDPENLQGIVSLEDSGSHSQEKDFVCPQGASSLGDSRSHSQKEDPERPQGEAPLGDSKNHSQKECPVMPQEKNPLENSKSHNQEEGPETPQGTSPLGASTSHGVRKSPKKQPPQEEKAKQPKGKKASDSQHGAKPALGFNPKNWECPWCKEMNYPWCKACYKCKKVCVVDESEGLDAGQTE